MLPFVLVLFVASSALAAPSVQVTTYNVNEIAPARDNGALVSSYMTDRSFELVDGGDTNIYILTIQQILNDMANTQDQRVQATAIAQTLAILGDLATGLPGDACDAAAVINGGSVRAYLNRLAANMDTIVTLVVNPNSLRYATGPRGNCVGGGRNYQFEAAWDQILNSANPYTIGLINEEYCAAKRLYTALNVRSNNVAASATAAALPPVVNAVLKALAPLANFLRVVASGGNPSAAAAVAKSALLA